MNWLDVGIILFLIAAFIRGRELGLVQQAGSTLGFFSGLFVGAFLQRHFITVADEQISRSLLSFMVIIITALLFLTIGEYASLTLKYRIHASSNEILQKIDRILGSAMAGITLLATVWLGSSLLNNLPSPSLQQQLRGSAFIGTMNDVLPPAPNVIAQVGQLINPNGFPKVFIGLEPKHNTNAPLPSVGDLQPALEKTRESIVKIAGKGCGGTVNGSGFVAREGLIATNAHVVAGVRSPVIKDQNGSHAGRVIWFNPDMDFAVIRASGLKGAPLSLQVNKAAEGDPAIVTGFPGGGDFSAVGATILDVFKARGRNIYNQGDTNREVYSLRTTIVPGNSGGPLINKDGEVIGMVFAQSTTYEEVGYALTMGEVINDFNRVKGNTAAVSTGSCTE